MRWLDKLMAALLRSPGPVRWEAKDCICELAMDYRRLCGTCLDATVARHPAGKGLQPGDKDPS